MASFCAQCSIEIWGHDDKDYEGRSRELDTEERRYARILCEGCGPTLADHRGFCVNPKCLRQHGIIVEECVDGDWLEAKPFKHVTEPVSVPFTDENDKQQFLFHAEPVGKDWLEGLDDRPQGEWPIDAIK